MNDRLRDEALAAAADGDLDHARRLVGEAIGHAPGNAGYWRALAVVERAGGRVAPAQRALRRALELSPGYARAQAELDELGGRAGPRAAGEGDGSEEPELELEPGPVEPDCTRTARYDWEAVGEELLGHGVAVLPRLLDGHEVEGLRATPTPLPPLVSALGEELYWRAAPVADEWCRRLGGTEPFPRDLAGLARRGRGGEDGPELLRLAPDAGVSPTVPAADAFPFELSLALGPGPLELVLSEARTGKHGRERALVLAPGDGALVAPRARLVEVGGVWGQQARRRELRAGGAEVHLLRVPFEEGEARS